MSTLQISQTDFVATHDHLDKRLQTFLRTKRGSQVATETLKNDLKLRSALSLKAINFTARTCFAELFSSKLRALLVRHAVDEVFFVTLNLHQHATTLDQAPFFDVTECKTAMSEFLKGLSFIGIVEAAFYYKAPFVPGAQHAFVSWHSHALVWQTKQSKLARRRRLFNRLNQSFVPGQYAVHYRRVTPTTALSYARYMSKSLLKEYTAFPLMSEVVDLSTGEILKHPTGRWRNRKRSIRSTNLVRAMKAMDRRTLKQLSFGGGAGEAFRRSLLRTTRRSLRADAAARKARRRRLLFGP